MLVEHNYGTITVVEMEVGGGGGGCTQFVHDRSPMPIDPHTSTMPGRNTSRVFTNQADITCTKREAP